MSSQQVRSNDATASASVASVDMKLEVLSSPSRMSIAQRSSIQGSGGGSTPTAPQVTISPFPVPSGRAFDGSRRSLRKSPRLEKENLCSCRE
jgi:hypothetical protein